MTRALYTAAAGMQAQQLKIDVIANNLANVNTDGFKRSRAEFQDLVYQSLRTAGAPAGLEQAAPTGIQVGLGVQPAATALDFSTGSPRNTGRRLDVAIQGRGLFQVALPSGETAYSRNGAFQVDAETGRLVNQNGNPLVPEIFVPPGANLVDLEISRSGIVTATIEGDPNPVELGRIELASMVNEGAFEPIGQNLFRLVGDDRDLVVALPGLEGMGALEQGFLESSNVQMVEEMIAMISGQRAYEANSRVIRTSDEMMQETNRLR
ncbi:MAG: flagellar basal-body rod protein FlgG [Myxococcota bacterium]